MAKQGELFPEDKPKKPKRPRRRSNSKSLEERAKKRRQRNQQADLQNEKAKRDAKEREYWKKKNQELEEKSKKRLNLDYLKILQAVPAKAGAIGRAILTIAGAGGGMYR